MMNKSALNFKYLKVKASNSHLKVIMRHKGIKLFLVQNEDGLQQLLVQHSGSHNRLDQRF